MTVKLFPDDTKLYREITNMAEATNALQSDLCAKTWRLKFNSDKCEIMPLTANQRDKSVPNLSPTRRGEYFKRGRNTKDLGVTVSYES